MVRGLARTPGGWRLTVGSAHAPEQLDADAVVLALPARAGQPAAGRGAGCRAPPRPGSARSTTRAWRSSRWPTRTPRSRHRRRAAATWCPRSTATPSRPSRSAPSSGRTCGPARRPVHIVRCSVGRLGEEALLQRDDAELAALAAADLAAATGVRGAPADIRVSRWGGGLPQYTVGHVGRVARIRAAVADPAWPGRLRRAPTTGSASRLHRLGASGGGPGHAGLAARGGPGLRGVTGPGATAPGAGGQ